MNIILAPRASAILYDLVVSHNNQRPFLIPANICPIVPLIFLKAKKNFIFVDISSSTLNMDLDAAADLIRKQRYGGIVYAHTYGEPSTPNDFFTAVKTTDPSLLVIDDRCLCIPDLTPDLLTSADAVLYSTGQSKFVDLGFGGYGFVQSGVSYAKNNLPYLKEDLMTIEVAYKESIKSRKKLKYQDSHWLETAPNHPAWKDYKASLNMALSSSLAQRRKINTIYEKQLPNEFQLPPVYQNWRFNLRIPHRDEIVQEIFSQNLFASTHYAPLTGIMGAGKSPHANQLANQVINLFNDHHFTSEMAERTCDIILNRFH